MNARKIRQYFCIGTVFSFEDLWNEQSNPQQASQCAKGEFSDAGFEPWPMSEATAIT